MNENGLLNFGEALEHVKKGNMIARHGWNGTGMFVYYVPAGRFKPYTQIGNYLVDEEGLVPYNAYLAIKTISGSVSTWVPSVDDCLAEDWYVVE